MKLSGLEFTWICVTSADLLVSVLNQELLTLLEASLENQTG